MASFRPGTYAVRNTTPNVETLGKSQESLRDRYLATLRDLGHRSVTSESGSAKGAHDTSPAGWVIERAGLKR